MTSTHESASAKDPTDLDLQEHLGRVLASREMRRAPLQAKVLEILLEKTSDGDIPDGTKLARLV